MSRCDRQLMITPYELTARSYPEDWDLDNGKTARGEAGSGKMPRKWQNQRVKSKVRPRFQVMGEIAADIQLIKCRQRRWKSRGLDGHVFPRSAVPDEWQKCRHCSRINLLPIF